jgi:hypothetical protein
MNTLYKGHTVISVSEHTVQRAYGRIAFIHEGKNQDYQHFEV